jgi:trimethylamine:corrinoid methyltransferase-like protein
MRSVGTVTTAARVVLAGVVLEEMVRSGEPVTQALG